MEDLLDFVDDIKTDIPDQKYIDIMNELMKINKRITQMYKCSVEYYQQPDNEHHDDNYYYSFKDALVCAVKHITSLDKPFNKNELYAIKTYAGDEDEYEFKYYKIDLFNEHPYCEYSDDYILEQMETIINETDCDINDLEIIQFAFNDDILRTLEDALWMYEGVVFHKDDDLSFDAEAYYHRVISITQQNIS